MCLPAEVVSPSAFDVMEEVLIRKATFQQMAYFFLYQREERGS